MKCHELQTMTWKKNRKVLIEEIECRLSYHNAHAHNALFLCFFLSKSRGENNANFTFYRNHSVERFTWLYEIGTTKLKKQKIGRIFVFGLKVLKLNKWILFVHFRLFSNYKKNGKSRFVIIVFSLNCIIQQMIGDTLYIYLLSYVIKKCKRLFLGNEKHSC